MKEIMVKKIVGLLFIWGLSWGVQAGQGDCNLYGKVVAIADGDTITVLDGQNRQHQIRFSGIDAPERGQPFGKASKKYLSKLIARRAVCVEWYKRDQYQRLIGTVWYKQQDINLSMVADGYAWHYKKYVHEQSKENQILFADAHNSAKSAVLGLWSDPDVIEPDQWRAGVRQSKPIAQTLINKPSPGFSCGGKRFCRHMQSCAEACYYLTQCGLGRLDRDKDGIPCESICGKSGSPCQ